MLKITLLCLAVLLFGTGAFAQNAENGNQKKSFLFLQGGAAIPLADFASSDLTNENAGMAKTGFSAGLLYNYRISKFAGIMLQGHYADFALSDELTKNFPGATVDHWQYAGLVVGPMLMLPVSDQVLADVHVASGVMWVNSPKVKFQGLTIIDEDWGAALPLQAGLHMRFLTNSKFVLFAGADYLYMKPEFRIEASDPPEVKQNISTVHLQLGFGFRF
jgi:hypothetical protein